MNKKIGGDIKQYAENWMSVIFLVNRLLIKNIVFFLFQLLRV
jgi:hypothetical protein